MKRKYIWLTIGLYLLLFFSRHDGRPVSMFCFELNRIYIAITENFFNYMFLFSIVHILCLTVLIVITRKNILSLKEKCVVIICLAYHAITPILISLPMGLRQQKGIYLTSIPFWVFSLIAIYYIAKIVTEKPATNTH